MDGRTYTITRASWKDSVSSLPLPAAILSGEGDLIYGNSLFARMIGLPEDRLETAVDPELPSGLQDYLCDVVDLAARNEASFQSVLPTANDTIGVLSWAREAIDPEVGVIWVVVFAESSSSDADFRQALVYAEELRQLYQSTRDHNRLLRVLHEASESVQKALKLIDLGPEGLRRLTDYYGCQGVMGMILPVEMEIHLFSVSSPDQPASHTVRSFASNQTAVMQRSLNSVRSGKERSFRWVDNLQKSISEHPIKPLPVVASFDTARDGMGFICLPAGVCKDDPEFLRAFTDQLSVAVGNAVLYDGLEKKANETETLLQSSLLLGSSLNVSFLIDSLVDLIAHYVLEEQGAIVITLTSVSGKPVLTGTVRDENGELTPLSSLWSTVANGRGSRKGSPAANISGERKKGRPQSNPEPLEQEASTTDPESGNLDQSIRDEDEPIEDLVSRRLFNTEGVQVWRAPLGAGKQQGELMVLTHHAKPLTNSMRRLLNAMIEHTKIALTHAFLLSQERAQAVHLARQQDARMQHLQKMAHELKTPLTAIRPMLELLSTSEFAGGDPRGKEITDIVGRGMARLENLANQYLNGINLPGSPERILTFQVTDVYALIADAVDLQRIGFEQQNQRVRVSSKTQETLAVVDPAAIEEIIGNLLSNCHKYAGAGAEVLVSLEQKPRQSLMITVSDNGPGLSDAQLRKLRRITSNLEEGESYSAHMGLRICSHLVELHGGEMWIRRVPSGGLKVGFSLPMG